MTDRPDDSAYGYQLQAPDGRWLVREIRPDGTLDLPWFVQWLDEHPDLDPKRRNFLTAGTWRLLATVGFVATEDDLDLDDEVRFDQWVVADEEVGVRIVNADAGLLLQATVAGPKADANLRSALAVLGLTPLQGQPVWFSTAGSH